MLISKVKELVYSKTETTLNNVYSALLINETVATHPNFQTHITVKNEVFG